MLTRPATLFHCPYVLPWTFLLSSQEVSIEVNFLPWTLAETSRTYMEVSGSFDEKKRTLVEVSTEVLRSFHYQWKWKLPLLPSIAASTNIFHGSFHELIPLRTSASLHA